MPAFMNPWTTDDNWEPSFLPRQGMARLAPNLRRPPVPQIESNQAQQTSTPISLNSPFSHLSFCKGDLQIVKIKTI